MLEYWEVTYLRWIPTQSTWMISETQKRHITRCVYIYICSMRLSIISYMHICLDYIYIYIIFIHTYMSTIQWTYSIFDSRLHDMIWYDLILIFSHLCVWIWLYIYTHTSSQAWRWQTLQETICAPEPKSVFSGSRSLLDKSLGTHNFASEHYVLTIGFAGYPLRNANMAGKSSENRIYKWITMDV